MSSEVVQQPRRTTSLPRMNLNLLLNLLYNSYSAVGIVIREALKDSANGVVKTAVGLLAVVASATQDVPYLGAISGLLTEVIKIIDVRFYGFIFTKYY
jgi:hypothetical protein